VSHKNKTIDPDIHFRVLHVLEEKPSITQRELARKLGISLGSVNFCLKELMNVGQIKVDNFKKNPDKSVYLYLLTPRGLKQKALLTAGFLKRKLEEYHALKIEIESIQTRIEN
jgi:EPS-associated MarR family transcriptional regulator